MMADDFQGALAELLDRTYKNIDVDRWSAYELQRSASIVWAVWETDDEVQHARVIRGRDLKERGLSHAAMAVEDEDEAVCAQEPWGDPIDSDGEGMLRAPEPAVPEHSAALLLAWWSERKPRP